MYVVVNFISKFKITVMVAIIMQNLNFLAKKNKVMLDGVILETCSKSSEYMQYRNLTNILDAASKISYWKIIGCIPRCKYTKYVLGPLYDSNFDQLKY